LWVRKLGQFRWLLEHFELSDEELGGICRYLEGERLITAGREQWGHHTPFMILLTHAGSFEGTERLIATRVHDLPGRARTPVLARVAADRTRTISLGSRAAGRSSLADAVTCAALPDLP
jgi:hypothetical protein